MLELGLIPCYLPRHENLLKSPIRQPQAPQPPSICQAQSPHTFLSLLMYARRHAASPSIELLFSFWQWRTGGRAHCFSIHKMLARPGAIGFVALRNHRRVSDTAMCSCVTHSKRAGGSDQHPNVVKPVSRCHARTKKQYGPLFWKGPAGTRTANAPSQIEYAGVSRLCGILSCSGTLCSALPARYLHVIAAAKNRYSAQRGRRTGTLAARTGAGRIATPPALVFPVV